MDRAGEVIHESSEEGVLLGGGSECGVPLTLCSGRLGLHGRLWNDSEASGNAALE